MDSPYSTGPVPPLVCGAGELCCLPGLLPSDVGSVLLVTDAGVAAAGLADRVEETLADGPPVTRFVAPGSEPTVATVDQAAARARALDRPVIVGLGGGTALDIAKLVAGLERTDRDLGEYLLGAGTFGDRAPAVMIPTTSGTGSEVTRTCIVSGRGGAKLWVWSPVLGPDSVLLDPELTTSMPRALAVATGLDAFVHALEAVTGQARNRFSEACGLQAIHLATHALDTFAGHSSDLAAAGAMQESAMLAGLAIDSGGTGIAHNIGHALGSLYHVPHGVAVAIALEASLEWSVGEPGSRFERAAEAFGEGHTVGTLPGAYAQWLKRLDFSTVAIPALPDSLDADALAATMAAAENMPMARNGARPAEVDDLEHLAQRTVALCDRYLQHREVPA
ncbi:MAG: iron-containing alcohol dehydrogenase [Halofilum sp. (in: g-proteobacteria)]